MTDFRNLFASQLSDMHVPTRYNEEEIKELRHRAWTEQSVLIVSPADDELLPHERRSLMQIGHKLYGEEGAA